jgi:hypothetical protein
MWADAVLPRRRIVKKWGWKMQLQAAMTGWRVLAF